MISVSKEASVHWIFQPCCSLGMLDTVILTNNSSYGLCDVPLLAGLNE